MEFSEENRSGRKKSMTGRPRLSSNICTELEFFLTFLYTFLGIESSSELRLISDTVAVVALSCQSGFSSGQNKDSKKSL
jgi:hypothetical protein